VNRQDIKNEPLFKYTACRNIAAALTLRATTRRRVRSDSARSGGLQALETGRNFYTRARRRSQFSSRAHLASYSRSVAIVSPGREFKWRGVQDPISQSVTRRTVELIGSPDKTHHASPAGRSVRMTERVYPLAMLVLERIGPAVSARRAGGRRKPPFRGRPRVAPLAIEVIGVDSRECAWLAEYIGENRERWSEDIGGKSEGYFGRTNASV
jgi:hypothetical protein